jgi:hypothetical protein
VVDGEGIMSDLRVSSLAMLVCRRRDSIAWANIDGRLMRQMKQERLGEGRRKKGRREGGRREECFCAASLTWGNTEIRGKGGGKPWF